MRRHAWWISIVLMMVVVSGGIAYSKHELSETKIFHDTFWVTLPDTLDSQSRAMIQPAVDNKLESLRTEIVSAKHPGCATPACVQKELNDYKAAQDKLKVATDVAEYFRYQDRMDRHIPRRSEDRTSERATDQRLLVLRSLR